MPPSYVKFVATATEIKKPKKNYIYKLHKNSKIVVGETQIKIKESKK